MQCTTVAILALVAVVLAADDECGPPPMGQKKAGFSECCSISWTPSDTFKANARTCMDKFPPPPRPQGPPPSYGVRPTPSPAMRNNHTCKEECVFSANGLLTADKKLNQTAVVTLFANSTDNATLTAAAQKCLGTYQADIDTTLDCKSGADVYMRCSMREAFLNCPTSKWTNSSDCVELKARVTKCPQLSPHLGHHHHMHRH